ncbi:MAG: hypothetical protein MZW92_19655 [Comamonadaceae bacterium]|nr:hypothetical protein [Comamonadaceae bacterium]
MPEGPCAALTAGSGVRYEVRCRPDPDLRRAVARSSPFVATRRARRRGRPIRRLRRQPVSPDAPMTTRLCPSRSACAAALAAAPVAALAAETRAAAPARAASAQTRKMPPPHALHALFDAPVGGQRAHATPSGRPGAATTATTTASPTRRRRPIAAARRARQALAGRGPGDSGAQRLVGAPTSVSLDIFIARARGAAVAPSAFEGWRTHEPGRARRLPHAASPACCA